MFSIFHNQFVNLQCPHKGHALVMLTVLPETQVAFFFFLNVVWQGFVAGETGNEEFWACLSTLILQLTGRQVMGSKPRCCASQQDTSQSKQCK